MNPKAYRCKRQKLLQRENSRPRCRVFAITAFAPSHDALNSLARIHSLNFQKLPDYDRETARQCSSMLAHFSYQRLFRTSLTGGFKIESVLGSRPVCAGHDVSVGLDLRPIGLCPATGFVPDYLNRYELGS